MKHGLNTDQIKNTRTYKCVVRLEKRICLPLQLIVGSVLVVGFHHSVAWYWLVFVYLPLELASVAVIWWPTIEPENGVVREHALLFGKKSLSERLTPLNEFTEIFCEHVQTSERDTGNFRLGLRHKNGRIAWVDGCWYERRYVEETAWEISCNTGIRLKDDISPCSICG